MNCLKCGVEMACEGVREQDGELVIDYWCMVCGYEEEVVID